MSDRNLPALVPAALPSGNELETLLRVGDMLARSGLLPNTLRTKEAAAVVVMKGNELGLPPMAAVEGISVVQGKAVIGAHLMLALVKRAYGPASIWVSATSNEACTVSYRIPGMGETLSYTYTMEDARKAGLAGKENWQKHPAAMLRARCISATTKLAFPEVVGGMYVPGEAQGTEEDVTPDGDVVIRVTAAAPVTVAEADIIDAEIVDAATGEIVQPQQPAPEPAPAAEPAPRPSKRSLGQRALALAMERDISPERLEEIGVEAAEGRPKAQWSIADLEALVLVLEAMPIPGPEVVEAELIEAVPGVDGEAGNDRYTL